eukprot:TRINITY_DN23668_c0_g1_i1.p2 TRINITY_DN23668_c0_g1~~TRINITY_DN23668_c0_g1_i1.p2  ORF type:complete len:125 (-),score=2.32 TRINITY_DN23668_c0_g1_i1:254-628(-)
MTTVGLKINIKSQISSLSSQRFRSGHANEQLILSPRIKTRTGGRDVRLVPMMGNKATTGPFAPLVRVTRAAIGKKEFNKIRGKAISLHSQIIKDFCAQIGAGPKQAQQVIRLAKKNGEWLGFLA